MVKSGKMKTFDELKKEFEDLQINENSYEVARGRMIKSAYRMIALGNIEKQSIHVGFGASVITLLGGTGFGLMSGLHTYLGNGGLMFGVGTLALGAFFLAKNAYYNIKKEEYLDKVSRFDY